MGLLNTLRCYVLERYAKKQEAQRGKHVGQFVTYKQVKQVLILFQANNLNEIVALEQLIKPLLEDGIDVTTCVYLTSKEVNSVRSVKIEKFNKKQVSWLQAPPTSILETLQDRTFDITINLTLKPTIPLQYLQISAPSLLRCGARIEGESFCDFMIEVFQEKSAEQQDQEPLETQRYLFNQIMYYLKTIQSAS